ncbi:MAG TPA: beta-carotene 15,15'-dioxygenase, Brp/Blh family [Saprospiraceae bacterium]|nr:beta-carotene 15,15'-dioxygenase, Brp/Blh family [Saprospiraceae bacterium]
MHYRTSHTSSHLNKSFVYDVFTAMSDGSSTLFHTKSNEVYDFIFIGLGASNSLIIISLFERDLLKNKKIAIIEPDFKNTNDKTYCFWAKPEDAIVEYLNPIITHRFTSISVNGIVNQDIQSLPYHYIRSIDLYNHTLSIIEKSRITILREAVTSTSEEHEQVRIHTDLETLMTKYVFDSRPPRIKKLFKNDVFLHQSFYGLHIQSEDTVFQKDVFEMMNFNIEQSSYTQFLYIIPFSSQEALVELTRFGADRIEQRYAEDILNKYISEHFGKYKVLATEEGTIPMATFINKPNANKRILNTGANANLIKPSTGYGFKKMHLFAEKITDKLVKGDFANFNNIALKTSKRFHFYDNLLLIILLLWPFEGKKIFSQLFQRQDIKTIFTFLDEKTSLYQEAKIFASLPIFPFIKALLFFIKNKVEMRYIFVVFAVLSYLLTSLYSKDIALGMSYFIVFLGFMTVGIPHGSLDHLLLDNTKSNLVKFILQYLFIMAIYFVSWHFLPLLSLVVFIIFSSFHFGESELEEYGVKTSTIATYIKGLLMGLSILLFIIFTHFEESMKTIAYMNAIPSINFPEANMDYYVIGIALLSLLYIVFQSINSKGYNFVGLILLLILGIKVPLLFAFGLYFIFQHSYNAWGHLQKGLQMNSVALYKEALPYTLGAFLILALLFYLNPSQIVYSEGFLAMTFTFLACISLPHFILMHLFYRFKN